MPSCLRALRVNRPEAVSEAQETDRPLSTRGRSFKIRRCARVRRVRFSLVTSDWSLGGFPLGENRTRCRIERIVALDFLWWIVISCPTHRPNGTSGDIISRCLRERNGVGHPKSHPNGPQMPHESAKHIVNKGCSRVRDSGSGAKGRGFKSLRSDQSRIPS